MTREQWNHAKKSCEYPVMLSIFGYSTPNGFHATTKEQHAFGEAGTADAKFPPGIQGEFRFATHRLTWSVSSYDNIER